MGETTATDDAWVMAIWRHVGLPEYFLGNGGTNHKLVAFAKHIENAAFEAACGALAAVAIAANRPECCGFGEGSPPECCANTDLLVTAFEAARAIRALAKTP
jgi:hypothetical protein